MPRGDGTALIARPGDSLGGLAMPRRKNKPAKAEAKPRWSREKIVKQSALGALLRPIGVSVALVLSAYALVSLGTTFYR
ncbi:MAG: hypothetical protein WBB50_13455, partial [Methyloceanibacter sp.]